MKLASQGGVQFREMASFLSWHLITSVILYGLSFLLTLQVLSQSALSIASPLMAGMTFIGITLASVWILHETLDMQKMLGILVIVIGIFILARSTP